MAPDSAYLAALIAGPKFPDAAILAPFATHFGQESADNVVDAPGRGLTLPANALLIPNALTSWYCLIRFRAEPPAVNGTNYEMIASKGGALGSGSTDSWLALNERGHTTGAGAWKLEFKGQNGSTSNVLMKNPSPALTAGPILEAGDHCAIIGMDALGIPHHAYGTVGVANDFITKGDSVGIFNGFFFPVLVAGTSITRTNNEAVLVDDASIAAVVGDIYYVESTDPTLSGIHVISRKPGSTSMAWVSVGPDTGAVASPNFAKQRALPNLFNTIGRAETAFSSDAKGFAGSVGRVEMRYGAMPLNAGLIDADWFDDLKNGRIAQADMPGTKRYASNLDPLASYAADADGAITGAATAIGTPTAASSLRAGWLRFDPIPAGFPMASDYQGTTGAFELGFTADAVPSAVYARVLDSTGAVVKSPKNCLAPGSIDGSRGTVRVADIPIGCDYVLQAWIDDEQVTQIKFDIGPVYGIISQSTYQVLFSTASTGSSLAPTNDSTGRAAIFDTSGALTDVGTNPTNTAAWHRTHSTPLRAAGQMGDGIVAFTNKVIERFNAALGVKVPVGVVNFCTSGHTPEIYYLDRNTYLSSIGTPTLSVALTGNWKPVTNITSTCPIYAEKGTVRLLVDGVQRAVADSSGNWSGTNVTGTFNHDTGAYSVTLTSTTGVCTIEGRMQYDTPVGSSSPRQTPDGFTCFGNGTWATGHVGNRLIKSPRRTADIVSWLNYFLSDASAGYSGGLQAKYDASIDRTLARIATFGEYPIIVIADPRTEATSEAGERHGRRCMKVHADANGYYFGGACLSAAMDALGSPHASSEAFGGRLIGMHAANVVCAAEGHNDLPFVHLVSATPAPDRTYFDLVFNVPEGASLVSGSGGEPAGIYGGTSAATLAELALSSHTVAITSANTVRITKDSGAFANPFYFDYAAGFPFASKATKAAADALCADMLFLNDGGFSGTRPGTPVQPTFAEPVSG